MSSFIEVINRQVVMQKVWLNPYTGANVSKKLKFNKNVDL